MGGQQPIYLLFAGVNGAGKSTLYHSGLWQSCAGSAAAGMSRVNPDEIALEHGCGPIQAGKLALKQISQLFDQTASFNQETTLTGRSPLKNIQRAKEQGYRIVLLYVGLESPQLAIERIRHRVETGGHDISPEAVQRRYDASIKNLSVLVHECDEAVLFDNTAHLRTIARWEKGAVCWWGGLAANNSWLASALKTGLWG